MDGRAKPDVDQSKEPKRLSRMERTRKGENLKERHGRGNAKESIHNSKDPEMTVFGRKWKVIWKTWSRTKWFGTMLDQR